MNIIEKTPPCRICSSQEVAELLRAREMMHGIRDQFTYSKCALCGCLQLDNMPASFDKYYPADYYSFQELEDAPISWQTKIKLKWLRPSMTRHKLGWGSAWGRLLCRFKNGSRFPDWLRFLPQPIPLDSAILDVGCGSGATLLMLRDCGFTNLHGVDPFIKNPIIYAGGVQVEKCQLPEVRGKFNLITFNHVCEHLDDPVTTLRQARRLLAEDGHILVRIPLSDSVASQKYRENWVQLDAPRHITLQTRKSMEILAQKTALKIIKVVYDSSEFQFTGSEQYLQDIPLRDPRSAFLFTPETVKQYALEAGRLNAAEKGDQAAFLLSA